MKIHSSYSGNATTHDVTLEKDGHHEVNVLVDGHVIAVVSVARRANSEVYRPEMWLWPGEAKPEEDSDLTYYWPIAL